MTVSDVSVITATAPGFDVSRPALELLTSIPFDEPLPPAPPDPDRDVGATFFESF